MDIELTGVGVAYKEQAVLENVNLRLPSGSSTAVVGVSGVGKTTLLRTLAGLIRVSKGSVRVGGHDPSQLYGKGALSFLFQEACLWPHLTTRESLELTYRLHKLQPDLPQITRQLHLAGLSDAASKYPHQLSVGMKARAALVRAFCLPPRVLLMDEPFAAVDPIRRLELNYQVKGFSKTNGCTIVWTTHDVVEALQFATHVLCVSPADGVSMIEVAELPEIDDRGRLSDQALQSRDIILSRITSKLADRGDRPTFQ